MGTQLVASRFGEDIYFDGVSSYRRCRHCVSIEKWRVVDGRKSEENEEPSKSGSKEPRDRARRRRRHRARYSRAGTAKSAHVRRNFR